MRPLLLGLLSSVAVAAAAALSLPSAAQAAPQPDLSLATACAVNGPQSALCTITVTNIGTLPSGSPLTLTDAISGAPANGQFTGGGGTLPISCTPGAGPILPISCHANASLAPGQSKNALFSFHLPTGGSLTSCATVNSAGDTHPANNTNVCGSVTVPGGSSSAPDLSVTKTCAINGPQSVLCTVTVTNIGTAASSSPITLNDMVSGAPSNGHYTGAGGTLPISCTPGAGPILPILCHANASLLPTQSKNALFSFVLPTGGSLTNCVTVSSAGDSHPANNTNICTSITVPPPGGCTGYPMVADVFFYNPMTPFGPQTVNICRGGHVLFHNVSTGAALTIQDLTSPGGQPLFASVSLPTNNSTAPTAALQTGSPATYEYKITGFVVHGHINVH